MLFSKLFNLFHRHFFTCSNKTCISDRVYFGLFSSAMFISCNGNFATRKLLPENCLQFSGRPTILLLPVSATIFLDVCHRHYTCKRVTVKCIISFAVTLCNNSVSTFRFFVCFIFNFEYEGLLKCTSTAVLL